MVVGGRRLLEREGGVDRHDEAPGLEEGQNLGFYQPGGGRLGLQGPEPAGSSRESGPAGSSARPRLISPIAPARMPMTEIRPPMASESRLAPMLGAPTSSRTTS